MDAFREAMNDCRLHYLGFAGGPFTCERGRSTDTLVRERLDRMLADSQWRVLFPRARVIHLAHYCSDNSPILLNAEAADNDAVGDQAFKFDPCC